MLATIFLIFATLHVNCVWRIMSAMRTNAMQLQIYATM